jgi:diacylglycerol kinase family enzyme
MRSDAAFFIVFNIGSGHGDPEAAKKTIADAMHAAGREHQLLEVKDPKQLPDIAKQAVKLAIERDGIVVAAGGDGTINSVAHAVLESERPFGVLPQGTFNYFARANGISQQIEESVQTLLTGRIQATQAGLINDRVFLVNASIGLYPRILEDREVYKARYGRHRIVALWSAASTVLRRHRHWLLQLEDERGRAGRLQTPTLFVGNNALQLQQVGLPQARDVEAGFLGAVAMKPIGRWALFQLSFHGALGRLSHADNVIYFSFRQLQVTPLRHHAKPLKVATDGEVTHMQPPIALKVSPHSLQLLVPRDAAQAEKARKA